MHSTVLNLDPTAPRLINHLLVEEVYCKSGYSTLNPLPRSVRDPLEQRTQFPQR